MKELLELCDARRRAAHVPHAVATVLRVEGSSYRRPGARMLVDINGRVAGSVSGGCLEKSVISQARAALLDGRPRLLSFDTTDQDDLAMGTSLGCEGRIWIGLEVLVAGADWPLENLVREIRRRRQPAVLITRVGDDTHGRVTFASSAAFAPSEDARDVSPRAIAEVLAARKTRFEGRETRGGTLIEWLGPPLALILLGGGPDVPPMVRLARELGHDVTVIDRRPEFAVLEQFPGAQRVVAAPPREIARHLQVDDRTAAVLMNHHYETDRDALAALLPLGLPYIALLGPRRRTERILAELSVEGHELPPEALRVIHGPAGLDIGAETPEQIALAVLAEIQAALAGRGGGPLRQRQAPIHSETFRENAACPLPV